MEHLTHRPASRSCLATTLVIVWLFAWSIAVQGLAQTVGTWREIGAPFYRDKTAMAYDSRRAALVLFGGWAGDAREYSTETWEWSDGAWSHVSDVGPRGRLGHAMAFDEAHGVVLVFGGAAGHPVNEVLGDTWTWDGAAWTLVAESGPSPRWNASVAYDNARGVTILFGGQRLDGTTLGDTWEWNGSTWSQVANSGPEARYSSAMSFDQSRNVAVLFGGRTTSQAYSGDTWEWNGASWSNVSQSGPPPRSRHAMAYDAAHSRTVLFGGRGNTQYGDTWSWNGSSWVMESVDGPSPRVDHLMVYNAARASVILYGLPFAEQTWAGDELWEWNGASWGVLMRRPGGRTNMEMAYDAARDETVLFGGYNTNRNYLDDTWVWDGRRWIERVVTAPSARSRYAMAYDAHREVVVLFGGADGHDRFGDTWEWNGSSWSQVSTSGPTARSYSRMVYDSARQVVLLFGGADASGKLGDTWEWNGSQWTQVSSSGPPPRYAHSMSFDSDRGVAVIQGGLSSGSGFDTWEWDGQQWQQVAFGDPGDLDHQSMLFHPGFGVTLLPEARHLTSVTWEWDGVSWQPGPIAPPPGRDDYAVTFDSNRQVPLFFGGGGYLSELEDLWEWQFEFRLVGQPQDLERPRGSMAQFHVEVEGSGPLEYQWRRDGFRLSDGQNISGSLTDTLTLTNLTTPQGGDYDCIVTGQSGSVTSDSAELYVVDPVFSVHDTNCLQGGGHVRVDWYQASRDGRAAVVFAAQRGQFRIPNGRPCAGTVLGLGSQLIQVPWTGSTGLDGTGMVTFDAPHAVCDRYLQFLDLHDCVTSNVIQIRG